MLLFTLLTLGAIAFSVFTIFFGHWFGLSGALYHGPIILFAGLLLWAWGERRREKKILAKFDQG